MRSEILSSLLPNRLILAAGIGPHGLRLQWAASALCLAASLAAFAQTPPLPQPRAQADPIQAYLQPLVQNHTIAGAVILVADRNGTLYQEAVGYRDLASRAPMPADALFWIASVSKPITASALMMLVDEGKVHLDDPVEKYLPEFKSIMVGPRHPENEKAGPSPAQPSPALVPASHPIRIREILNHTAGLRFRSAAEPEPGALDLLPLKDAVRSFSKEPLLFQPGTDYQYSNEGLDIAGRIIEVVTGMPYEQFLQQRLFDPLGMKDTTFWPNAAQISRLAESYQLDSTTHLLKEVSIDQLTYPLDDRQHRYPMPAGGLFSTASDLSIFCRMILNGGVLNGKRYLSAAAIHQMTIQQNHGFEGQSYGLAWSVDNAGFGHGGAFKNALHIDPATGRILVFMVQQDGPWGTPAGDAIVPTLERLANQIDAPATVVSPSAAPL